MQGIEQLQQELRRIDGRGYKAYKDIQGAYAFPSMTLFIDHVQGDPFAAPSKVRVRVPIEKAGVPETLFSSRVRRAGLEDYVARCVAKAIRKHAGGDRGSGKSGLIAIDSGGQEVLERTAVAIRSKWIEARLEVGLPAAGRRVLGREAEEILCQDLVHIARDGLHSDRFNTEKAQGFVECVENQEHIRGLLDERKLTAFIANGAILPRASGASDAPLAKDEAVLFKTPSSLRVSFELPNPLDGPRGSQRTITGLGVPKGVTLIVGGGYHGKSTVLDALERCVYPHIPGDGREYVVTAPDAMKIRAEDGRRVERVDISPFIADLPYGRSTTAFSSDDASGSTSQAANIIEALEAGSKTLLVDEDTSATNFMVRDARMQALVRKEHEPITPFLDRVRELYDTHGISTVLVMGGSGDYFDPADTVIMMREYVPYDATHEAKAVAAQFESVRVAESNGVMDRPKPRIPMPESFDASRGKRDVKIDAKGLDLILYGRDPIELRHIEQLVDMSQTRAIGNAIFMAAQRFMNDNMTLAGVLDALEKRLDEEGVEALSMRRGEAHPGNLARPRRLEIAAAINRLRTVRMKQA